jgi:hypothetical protein
MVLSEFAPDGNLGLRAELLAYRLLLGPELVTSGRPFASEWGIIGAGIDARWQRPFVFVTTEHLDPNRRVDARELSNVRHVLDLVGLSGEEWRDVFAWGTPDPELEVKTGDVVRAVKRGMAGPPVEWGSPLAHGILVSGHVVGNAKTVNDASGNFLGNVKESHEATRAGIDIALVELSAASTTTRFSGPVRITGKTSVDLIKSGGSKTDDVIAKAGWLYWTAYAATYLDLYVTNSVISVSGDSGSVAVVSGTRDVVGTLVGSSAGVGSLIQDANTQLSAFKTATNLKL